MISHANRQPDAKSGDRPALSTAVRFDPHFTLRRPKRAASGEVAYDPYFPGAKLGTGATGRGR